MAKIITAIKKKSDIHAAAVQLGKLGGQTISPAKSAAARENGKKGGRPPKEKPAA